MSNTITIISLNREYVDLAKKAGFKNVHNMRIQEYRPIRKNVFYVSPANALGFMDGGIDMDLSRVIMPDIEKTLKRDIRKYGKTTLLGRKYLPIGSSIICEPDKRDVYLHYLKEKNCHLISAPTMLLPQDVSNTENCYYACMASLYNVFVNCKYDNAEVIFTSMACGYGNMTSQQSLTQFINALKNYKNYKPSKVIDRCVLHEPNLDEQPLYYENTEWKNIEPNDIIIK